jgi:diguanylate cyclase (GGDEF)-like protein
LHLAAARSGVAARIRGRGSGHAEIGAIVALTGGLAADRCAAGPSLTWVSQSGDLRVKLLQMVYSSRFLREATARPLMFYSVFRPRSLRALLVAASAVLAVLVIGLACWLALGSLHAQLDERQQRMREQLDAYLLWRVQPLVDRSERQLDLLYRMLDLDQVRRGESPVTMAWRYVSEIKPERHFVFFYNLKHRRLDSFPFWPGDGIFQPETRPWFRVAQGRHDGVQWIGPYTEYTDGRSVVSMVRQVRDHDGSLLGLLVVDFSVDILRQDLDSALGGSGGNLLSVRTAGGAEVLSSGENPAPDDVRIPSRVSSMLPLPEHAGGLAQALLHGIRSERRVAGPEWVVQVSTSGAQLRAQLWQAFHRSALALICVVLLLGGGFFYLLRVLRHEQAMIRSVLNRLEEYGQLDSTAELSPARRLLFVRENYAVVGRLVERFRLQAHALDYDCLTGALTRHAFNRDLAGCWQSGGDFGLMLFDVDHFKGLNDRFGHPFGDAVLQRIVARLDSLPWPVACYRLGGDEFALVLEPGIGQASFVHAFLRAVAEMEWREVDASVSISIGGVLRHEADSQEALIALADRRLYACKRRGRGCALVSDGVAGTLELP